MSIDGSELSELAMRALDTIVADYGEDAELLAASIIFEVKAVDDEGEPIFHVNYKSLPQNSPHHIAGLYMGAANWLVTPES